MKHVMLCPRRQRGGVLILVGISLAVLIGFLGIVVDLGRLFVTKTELQNAMDSCALAAASELRPGVTPPDPDALTRAEAAGFAAGARNSANLQSDTVAPTPPDITMGVLFSANLSDSTGGPTTFPYGYQSSALASPGTARYAMCWVSRANIATWFMQVLEGFLGENSSANTVSALAVATLDNSTTSCAVPIGICQQAGGPAPNYGLVVGKWYSSKFIPGPGSAAGEPIGTTGNFNWVDFTPTGPAVGCTPATITPACSGGGANELKCLIEGDGQCQLPEEGSCVGATGAKQSLVEAWNSRFGVYKGGGVTESDLLGGTPDYTGYGYSPSNWQPTSAGVPENTYSGTYGSTPNFVTARSTNQSYSGATETGFNGIATSTQLDTYGADRRLVTVPIVNCDSYGPTPGQSVPLLGYACVLMLNPFFKPHDDVYLEYLGRANVAGSPCATGGSPGGSTGPLIPVLVQ